MSLRSMTGYGDAAVGLPRGRLIAELRSVNGRYLDVRTRLPRELGELTMFAEQVVRGRLRRGRVEVAVRTEGSAPLSTTLDLDRAREMMKVFGELAREVSPSTDVPLSLLTAVPDLFVPPTGEALDTVKTALEEALHAALDAREKMCCAEGRVLAADLAERARRLLELAQGLEVKAEAIPGKALERLRGRIDRLRQQSAGATRGEALPPLDPGRVEAEAVAVADRCDVTEELTRLRSHLEQFLQLVEPSPATTSRTDGEGADAATGRRLDFLLQEMLREANTMGAKSQDAAMSHEVISMKVELERMREQVQNVE